VVDEDVDTAAILRRNAEAMDGRVCRENGFRSELKACSQCAIESMGVRLAAGIAVEFDGIGAENNFAAAAGEFGDNWRAIG